jgi:hypothetical protein
MTDDERALTKYTTARVVAMLKAIDDAMPDLPPHLELRMSEARESMFAFLQEIHDMRGGRMTMSDDDKAREDSARAKLRRRGLIVRKSRIRDERDPRFGGYLITDGRNRVTHGGLPNAFSLTLDDVEAIAKEDDDG